MKRASVLLLSLIMIVSNKPTKVIQVIDNIQGNKTSPDFLFSYIKI